MALFSGLTEDQLHGIDARMVSLSWAEGDALFTAGRSAGHLYVLVEGRVKLSQTTAEGYESVVDLLAPGDLFGSLHSLGEPEYVEDAWALTTTCALRIEAFSFREILAEYPQVALRVLDDTVRKLTRARFDVGRQSTPVEQRVASVLLRMDDKFGQQDGDGSGSLIQIPLSRTDLAGMTGAATESVSRVMSRLRASGVIDSGRRWTAICDRDRLAAIAEPDDHT